MGEDAAPSAVVVLRRDGRDVLLGPVYGSGNDLGLVDDLLRVQLAARRFGWCIRLQHVRQDLGDLLDLAGLTEQLVG
jgi:hypothetical protein